MNIVNLLKKNALARSILILIGLSVLLIVLVFRFLNIYTHHGEQITVPDFSGLVVNELETFTENRDLRYEIVDSIFDATREKGSVVAQNPPTGSKVKKERTVYLTVVSKMPERVSMPDLRDLSLRQAISKLETYGLAPGQLEYIPNIAKNAVLKQKYREVEIETGTMIRKGSVIDLVLGEGLKSEKVSVPFLYGLTKKEAEKVLAAASLNIGYEQFEEAEDTSLARIYKQRPACSTDEKVFMGTAVDLWYTAHDNYDFDALIRRMAKDTAQ